MVVLTNSFVLGVKLPKLELIAALNGIIIPVNKNDRFNTRKYDYVYIALPGDACSKN